MLGADQLCRVAETANAAPRVKELGGPVEIRFSDGIKFLVERGAIPEGQSGAWDAVRRLRNETSHPRFQQQIPPGVGVGMLHRVNELHPDAAFRSLSRPTSLAVPLLLDELYEMLKVGLIRCVRARPVHQTSSRGPS